MESAGSESQLPEELRSHAARAADLLQTGRYREAEDEAWLVVRNARRILGKTHPETNCARAMHAAVLHARGRNGDARLEIEEVIGEHRRRFGPDDLRTVLARATRATIVQALGETQQALDEVTWIAGTEIKDPDAIRVGITRAETLHELGRSEEALSVIDDVAERCAADPSLGSTHPHTLAAVTARAAILDRLGRSREALDELDASIVLLQRHRAFGPAHPGILAARAQRAATLAQLGRCDRSLIEIASVIATCRAPDSLGEHHPVTIAARSQHAALLYATGNYRKAGEESSSVVRDAVRILGEHHPEATRARTTHATVLHALGRNGDARREIERAIRDYTIRFGTDDSRTILARATRATIVQALGEMRTALAELTLITEAQAGLSQLGTPESIRIQTARAEALHELGRYDEARAAVNDVVDRCTAHPSIGPRHPHTLAARTTRAAVLDRLGRSGDALEELTDAIPDMEQHPALGPRHPQTIAARAQRATTLTQLGQHDRALAEIVWVVRARHAQDGLSADHPATIRARAQHAALLQATGDYRGAEEQARSVVQSASRTLGKEHPETILAEAAHATILHARGHTAEADHALSRASSRLETVLGVLHPVCGATTLRWATVLRDTGQTRQALDVAVRGVSILNRGRYALGDAISRDAWYRHWEWAIAATLDMARDDGRLVAELVELARVQAVPTHADSASLAPDELALAAGEQGTLAWHTPGGAQPPVEHTDEPTQVETANAVASLAAGEDPISAPPWLVVGGRSRLREVLRSTGDVDAPEVALEDVADGVAPHDATVVWWGSWVAGGHLYQSLLTRGPDDEWEAHTVEPQPWSNGLDRCVAAWERACETFLRESADGRARPGGELAPPNGEAWLLGAIARSLLPAELVGLLRNPEPDRPLWVVAAPAPELARVPLAFLPVGDTTMWGRSAHRVLDFATVVYSPSVALQWAIRTRHGDARPATGRVGVSVVDPRDDLDHARPVAEADRILAGPAHAGGHPVPTKAGVLGALAAVDGDAVHIAAHAVWRTRKPADTGLLLADGDELTARELLYEDRPVRASCVTLACCASAGLAGGSAEWLGLAPALLWAGAASVVSTLWPIRDHPRGVEFEHGVALDSARAARPAATAEVLRDHQLASLGAWRDDEQPGDGLHALDFAAYIAVVGWRPPG